jgi:tetratricopeptide (TPR) repeat protein
MIRTKINDTLGLANSYLKMGKVYNYLKDNEQAEDWFFKGMSIALEVGNYKQLASGFNHRGLNILEQGDTVNAIQYLQNSLKFARNLKAKALTMQLLDTLSHITAQTNQFELAYYYMIEKENILKHTPDDEQDIKLLIETNPSKDYIEKNKSLIHILLSAIIVFLTIYIFVLHKRIRKIFSLLKIRLNENKR